MTHALRIEVGVCTFRRSAVRQTLLSLAGQSLPPGVTMAVIVADNDETPEAERRVRQAAVAAGLALTYVHAPARNISLARNACLDAASGDFLAFLDDDETASPGWLSALLDEAERQGWDAVLGPVDAIYGPEAPPWMRAAGVHSTRPVKVGGRILKGYAGNVLIRRATVEAVTLRFDLALGRQGGEDDDFFYRLTDAGGRIGYAPEAVAYEPVPPARLSLGWLIRRSFRTGQTHGGRLAARTNGVARVAQAALALVKTVISLAGALIFVISPPLRCRWLLRAAMHFGAVARLFGFRVIELY